MAVMEAEAREHDRREKKLKRAIGMDFGRIDRVCFNARVARLGVAQPVSRVRHAETCR